MSEENDFVARHAERRRAFLAKTATTSPVVGLLLAQASRPARAATYGGGHTTTTPFETSTHTITLPSTTAATTTSHPLTTTAVTTTSRPSTTIATTGNPLTTATTTAP